MNKRGTHQIQYRNLGLSQVKPFNSEGENQFNEYQGSITLSIFYLLQLKLKLPLTIIA